MSLGLNLGTNIPFEVLEGNFLNNLKDYYQHPAKYYMEPFRMFGNLYYVGDRKVCSHLIDTGDGLILFDSGYTWLICVPVAYVLAYMTSMPLVPM